MKTQTPIYSVFSFLVALGRHLTPHAEQSNSSFLSHKGNFKASTVQTISFKYPRDFNGPQHISVATGRWWAIHGTTLPGAINLLPLCE